MVRNYDFKRMSVLKVQEDTSSAACELTMLQC